jgi:6-phosphogluconate dehydrogenase
MNFDAQSFESPEENRGMQLGMIGLGRMGANMVRRLMRGGHECVVYDRAADAVAAIADEGATGVQSLEAFCARLSAPRAVWLMVPADVVDAAIDEVTPWLSAGDVIVDGGNSHYRDDVIRAQRLADHGLHYVDCGTSGGVFGLERGYCLMIGGDDAVVRRLEPLFATLAPGTGLVPVTPGRESRGGTAHLGYLHCGPHGAGHFVKMVHNGIEYGLMAAYAEGFNIMRHAGIGDSEPDAGAPALRHPQYFKYDFDLEDIAELWRRGSVVTSWLLDLTAAALAQDPRLDAFSGEVADSGEGRWTIDTAVEQGVPAHVLAAALFQRFSSRGRADFGDRLLSAMRFGFGGHLEPAPVASERKSDR